MMWGFDYGMGWMWVIGSLSLIVLVALIVLIVRAFTGGTTTSATPPSTYQARQIAEERLARGEITPEEFRELIRTLDENRPR